MTKSKKMFLGALSLLPLLLMVVYLVLAMNMFFSMIRHPLEIENGQFPPALFLEGMLPALLVGIVMGIASIGLLIYFIIHVVNNKNIDGNERLIWILVLIFAGMIGFPVYWYMRIWKDPLPQPSLQKL
jgi:Phospholipase_D-nuclease N-terminal